MELDEAKKILNNAGFILEDTDEFDDADLGLNVDPEEYHKHKSLQRTLQQKLDSIKTDLNVQTKNNIEELKIIAKKLNDKNIDYVREDNTNITYKWLKYKGPVTEDVLIKAFIDGVSQIPKKKNLIEKFVKIKLEEFKNSEWLKTAITLLNNETITVYRGIGFSSDLDNELNLLNNLKYLKYNLMERNSWTTSLQVAERYGLMGDSYVILQMICNINEVNLPLSSFLYGRWYGEQNEEFNLKKSFEVKDIKIKDFYVSSYSKEKFKNKKIDVEKVFKDFNK